MQMMITTTIAAIRIPPPEAQTEKIMLFLVYESDVGSGATVFVYGFVGSGAECLTISNVLLSFQPKHGMNLHKMYYQT